MHRIASRISRNHLSRPTISCWVSGFRSYMIFWVRDRLLLSLLHCCCCCISYESCNMWVPSELVAVLNAVCVAAFPFLRTAAMVLIPVLGVGFRKTR
ncbi:hypothetical protein CALVIDRAFT_387532 [Calocera viscosa TUFC12733]|uniref:Uncharacterized protein n=1 Tax=Calocera viscosa (strain TUFC12733) TaxID=1330018 RepID=A0A167GLP2_CALVF|nr:hypothetical protein CALVIDRAFT_387532 [Calocera viscosa TUFC12733]